MKKLICGVLAVLSLTALFAGCGNEPIKEPPKIGFVVADQFAGYRVGYVKGITEEKELTDNIPSPEVVKFSSVDKGLSALRGNKIHGLVLPAAETAYALEKYSDISKLYMTFLEREICAISLADNKYAHGIDAAVTTITGNGTADEISGKHLSDGKYERAVDYNKVDGRVLSVGISEKTGAPLFYKDKKDEVCGINIDSAYEFAKGIHAELKITTYPDDEALFKALDKGEIDLAMSDFVPSEENPISAKYLYTHPYCNLSTHILINGETPRIATEGLSALGK